MSSPYREQGVRPEYPEDEPVPSFSFEVPLPSFSVPLLEFSQTVMNQGARAGLRKLGEDR